MRLARLTGVGQVVTRILYSGEALDDLDRLLEFLAANDPATTADAVARIVEAVSMLERHPDIGRAERGRLRELVISHGRTGYVALYRTSADRTQVEILAIRHQREAGYSS